MHRRIRTIIRNADLMRAACLMAVISALGATTSTFATAANVVARAASHESSAAASAALDKLQHHYDHTRSFEADFTEDIESVGAPKRIRSGTVYFQKPGKMRWDFTQPSKETVVSDGRTIYDYDPGLNQVVETPLEDAIRAPGATDFLLGQGNIKRDFVAEEPVSSARDGLLHLILTPRAGGNSIDVGMDPASGKISTITIKDELGNVTLLRLTNVRDNVEITDSQFSFKAPAGADIVRPDMPE